MRISVITPTYNRSNTLERVFHSLEQQTMKSFEWIIIDDGSIDNTKEVVSDFSKKAKFDINYIWQENNGKHIAVNKGVSIAKGEFIAIADSDDVFLAESFEKLLSYWDSIPEEEKKEYRGVTCRCYDPLTMLPIGKEFKNNIYDMNGLDSTYKYHNKFEMWGINRTSVMKEFPFPSIMGGAKSGLRFYPETVIWNNMGRKYKVRFVNDCLRGYYKDQSNATTNKKQSRAKENIYLWKHYINDILDYFIYNPKLFIKAFIGLIMDGLLCKMKITQIIALGKGKVRKLLITVFLPLGYMAYLYKKKTL